MAYTYDQVMTALRNADAAGNNEDAARLAQIANSMRQNNVKGSVTVSAAPSQPATEEQVSSWAEKLGLNPTQETRQTVQSLFGLGSPIARFAKGYVVDPLLGINQTLANTPIFTNPVFGSSISAGANKAVSDYEAKTEAARAAQGSEGFDWIQLGGAISSPVNKFLPGGADTAKGRILNTAGGGMLFSAFQPIKDAENYVEDKVKQIGLNGLFGLIAGTGIEAASKIVQVGKEIAKPLTEKGRTEALRKWFNDLTNDKQNQIVAALKNAEELVTGSKPTAAEAVFNIPEAAALSAYQKQLAGAPEKGISGRFAARAAEQEAARSAELGTIAQTPEALAAAQQARTALTTPLRESALSQANIAAEVAPKLESEIANLVAEKTQALQIGGKLGTEASQQANRLKTTGFYPVEGMPRVPSTYRPAEHYIQVENNLAGAREAGNAAALRQAQKEFKQMQLESLSQNGFYPLESGPIIAQIDSVLNTPGYRGSKLVQQTLDDVKQQLQSLTNDRGVIDSRDLYTIRKEIGSTISSFASATGNWDKNLVTKLDIGLKKSIDNAIEKASGSKDWSNYLTTYQQASDKINRMEIGQKLEQSLGTSLGNKERAGVFAQAVLNAPQTIKKSTGQARYTRLDEILTPKEVKSVDNVIADLSRQAKAETLASKSRAGEHGAGEADLPNLLSKTASITNFILKKIRQDANKDLNSMAADMLLNPAKLAAFIEGVPADKTNIIVKAFLGKLTPELRNSFIQRFQQQGIPDIIQQNQ